MLDIKEAIATFGNMKMAIISEESIILEYKQATERKNKDGKVTSYSTKGDAVQESISVEWFEDNQGSQCLSLKHKTELVASFNLRSTGEIEWLPNSSFGVRSLRIAKPIDPANDVITSYSLYNFFEQWVESKPFSLGFNQLAKELIYPPAVVKLLLLFISYMTERTRQAEILKKFSSDADLNVDKDRVKVMFHYMMGLLVDSKRMKRLYGDCSEFIALPANKDEILALVAEEVDQPEPIVEETVNPDTTEDDQSILTVEPETVETVQEDTNTDMIDAVTVDEELIEVTALEPTTETDNQELAPAIEVTVNEPTDNQGLIAE